MDSTVGVVTSLWDGQSWNSGLDAAQGMRFFCSPEH